MTSSSRQAFILATGADTGGAAIRSVEAFRNYKREVDKANHSLQADTSPQSNPSNWEVRAMVAASNYIKYTPDLPYNRIHMEVYYDNADVVHLNHTTHGHTWYDAGQGKPVVLMHHGLHQGSFDVNLEQSIALGTKIGAVQVGSTANLELFGPITWTPIPYDLNQLKKLRKSLYQPDPAGFIRIVHAPTNREVKSTAALISAVEILKNRGLKVKLVLIEHQTHAECLIQKANAEILVDQLKLGYGCNAIEAWGMGIPVVGGIESPKWQKHMVQRWGSMPLFEATEANLADRLQPLVENESIRQMYTELGMLHVQKWHSQRFHVDQMSEIYSSAKPTTPPPRDFTRRRRLPGQSELTATNLRAERLARLRARGRL